MQHDIDLLARGRHSDPFAVLGVHNVNGERIVRTLQPHASAVRLADRDGAVLTELKRIGDSPVFTGSMPPRLRHYLLQVDYADGNTALIEDPYRFPAVLGELDRHLLGEGSHLNINRALGSHCTEFQGVRGTRFAVWAPNASRVSIVGNFNGWDGRCHPMRFHAGNGLWEIFLPAVGHGTFYKYELLDGGGNLLPLKSDPLAQYFEAPPGNASIVFESSWQWQDADWMQQRRGDHDVGQPLAIYEVHAGSWQRKDGPEGRFLTWWEMADGLLGYVTSMGFTHIELMPVSEHPFDGSWGYQPIGLYAPTQRFGDPDDFRGFVDACHRAGIGVIVDWVPAHFPKDEHGLSRFDGTALYEHADPRMGEHADWGTLVFNFGRREVANYLLGSAMHWIDDFHVDGLRVDAVASMLYLDYSRKDGEWIPNKHGGNENLEAASFLKQFNEIVHAHGAISLAEESTSWPGVSRPVYAGGLGFTYKWNMGWMNDTLRYMQEDPLHRSYHHDKMTFGPMYAFSENFVLPLSHDEVVHGKRSLLGRMPGDNFQRFANLRAYLGFMYAHPGKKLLFMGGEFAQEREWSHDRALDWHLLEQAPHRGVQTLVRELNAVYRSTPALHELDCDAGGFAWINWADRGYSVLSWIRRAGDGSHVVCISNFTPVVRHDYLVGVPHGGHYSEFLNTDAGVFGGSNVHNGGTIPTRAEPAHEHEQSLRLTLPPLATVILAPVS
ncbi:MAG: 1,4-alpha-glucan branching protein GlgB [Woeseia sp.]